MSKKDANSSGQQPLQRKSKMCVVTPEQAKHLLNAAQDHPLEALVTVALTTGLRRGELLGLQWQDIDVEHAILHVSRIVSPMGKIETAAIARIIALPKIALDALKKQRSCQEEVQAKASKGWHDLDLIFPNERGQYLDPGTLQQQSQALFVAAGLPHMYFHDLRRSTAALLLVMGADGRVVHTILGYRWMSPILSALVPVSLSMQREVMQKWDDLLLEE